MSSCSSRRSASPSSRRRSRRPLPDYRTGDVARPEFPTPIASHWNLGSITRRRVRSCWPSSSCRSIAVALWWLLGHTRFGEAVRAWRNERRPRPPHRHQPEAGVDRDLDDRGLPVARRGDAVRDGRALVGDRRDRSRDAAARPDRGARRTDDVVPAASPARSESACCTGSSSSTSRNVSRPVVSSCSSCRCWCSSRGMSRSDDTGGESFAFAPRVPPVPERLRAIWWVRHMPRLIGFSASAVAAIVPLVITRVGSPVHIHARFWRSRSARCR